MSKHKEQHVPNEEWAAGLRERFPKIFPEPAEIAIAQGWRMLIETLCEALQELADHGQGQAVALQVKQKFGELRFYMRLIDAPNAKEGPEDEVRHHETAASVAIQNREPSAHAELIGFARRLSVKTCETCGAPGSIDPKAEVISPRCTRHRSAR